MSRILTLKIPSYGPARFFVLYYPYSFHTL
nr:MAG TPA: hypothetical protein [Caudoviricetes sp.]